MRRDWKEVKLGECINLQNGFAFKSKFFTDNRDDLVLIKGSNLGKGRILWDSSKYWRKEDEKEYSKFLLKTNDIVLAMDRTWVSGGIKYAVIKKEDPKSLLVQRISCLRSNEMIEQSFLKYIIASNSFSNYVKNIQGGVGVPHISPKQVKGYEFHLPPLKTQRKIAQILSAYDDLIENNRRRIALLEEQAQLTYEDWFVRMQFPGFEDVEIVDGLPKGWEKKKIGEFVKTSSGGTPSKKMENEYYKDGTIPWIRTKELKQFLLIDSETKITPLALKKSSAKLFPENTVLLAMYGNTIGETTFLTFEASSNQACCAFLVGGKTYKSYFLHQFLLSNKDYILGFRMGAAQENISQSIIKNIEITIPKENVLIDFGLKIESVYSLIKNLTHQNRLLQEGRDILLPRLMLGIVDVEEI